MKRYCFYCALPDLVPQAEDGAFAALDPDRWRVTATLTAISARPAHAVTEGTLFFQYSEVANRLNCVLSPDRSPGFPDSPVQFIVYRGIELDSLVEADGQTLRQGDGLLQRLWAAQLDYNAIFGPSLNPTIDLLGVDTGVALEELVDHEGAGLVGAELGERALEGASDRGADCVHDHCFRHAKSFSLGLCGLGVRAPGRDLTDKCHQAAY